jgi:hypothetical protein
VKNLTECLDEIKKLEDKMSELSKKVRVSEKNAERERHMFWAGALIGILGGALGGIADGFYMRLLDFQSMSYITTLSMTIGFWGIFFVMILVLRAFLKSNPPV